MATHMGYRFNPEALKRIREQKGVSQGALSRNVGCTSSAISQYENGRSVPSAAMVAAFAEVLQADVMSFIHKAA